MLVKTGCAKGLEKVIHPSGTMHRTQTIKSMGNVTQYDKCINYVEGKQVHLLAYNIINVPIIFFKYL